MKVYGCPNSRSLRVVWALEEVGARYEYVRVDLASGGGRTEEFRKLNPAGKVPVLVVDDAVLTESAAICLWLGSRFADSALLPEAGSAAHAQVLRWTMFVATELEQSLWTLAKHSFALPEAVRVSAVKDTARWEFERAATVFAEGLGDNAFIAGGHFSVADILAAHTIAWANKAAGSAVPDALNRYMKNIMARPALLRAREVEAG